MLGWNAVAVLTLLGAEPSVSSSSAPSVEVAPPKNVVWIEPIAGGIGRASVSYERALGKGATLHVDALGGLNVGSVTDVAYNSNLTFNSGAGLLGVGFRAFPLGEAPFGPWVGASVRAGFGAMDLEATAGDGAAASHKETVFIGEGELRTGYTLALLKGLSVQGALGVGGRYLRFLDGMAGETLTFGLSTWLGVGYAF
jgi:hypothetical protein